MNDTVAEINAKFDAIGKGIRRAQRLKEFYGLVFWTLMALNCYDAWRNNKPDGMWRIFGACVYPAVHVLVIQRLKWKARGEA